MFGRGDDGGTDAEKREARAMRRWRHGRRIDDNNMRALALSRAPPPALRAVSTECTADQPRGVNLEHGDREDSARAVNEQSTACDASG